MKQASFQIGNSLNKEKNNISISEYVTTLPKEVNKNTIHTITNNKPRKLVENIYYF